MRPEDAKIEAQRILAGLFDDESERARYMNMLRRMSMNPVSAIRLARQAGGPPISEAVHARYQRFVLRHPRGFLERDP